ncbi:hypothetical protein ABID22_000261 [Pontibacter aydingkolensis]|uniref:RGS domain-containing protein n=1 Tax=Pontibacter aydingkolensis TaxID=1911536 RepID=A0ABS7CQL9_9BACT|nr:hypothetical protein [Pontibacter aydingkolensis]MBW7466073.1 hypothetical protein [Pontibacter aydingkolensis]
MKKVYAFLALLLTGCTVEQELVTDNPTNTGEQVIASGVAAGGCEQCAASEFGVKQEPDTAFTFSNGKRLLICGYYELQDGKKVFSEFVLSQCGDRDIVDFWEAAERYEVVYTQDTLKLHKLELLALGANRELVRRPWLTEYFYYKGNRLKRDVKYNTTIKYNHDQISETLHEYENTTWLALSTAPENYEEEKMVLANRLLISAISGSDKAEEYLKDFNNKIKAEGAYAEWYTQIVELQKAAKKAR